MRLTILDGRMMTSRKAAHEYLADALDLPSCYGHNLDALYDCLTDLGPDDFIIIENAAQLRSALGGYGEGILCVFSDACTAHGPTVAVLEN